MIYAIIAVVLIIIVVIIIYNALVKKKNDVENAFASIDDMLWKRYDLNLNTRIWYRE